MDGNWHFFACPRIFFGIWAAIFVQSVHVQSRQCKISKNVKSVKKRQINKLLRKVSNQFFVFEITKDLSFYCY